MTHKAGELAMAKALKQISQLSEVKNSPLRIRVED
jgi:hypothetical protein